jgi:outer membrane protein W
MKSVPAIIAIALIVLAAVPAAHAATGVFNLTGWVAWVDPNSSGTFNSTSPNQPFDINFKGKMGYGAGVNAFLGSNVSLAIDAVEAKPEAELSGFATGSGGSVRMIPLTGVLQFHFMPKGMLDPYVGAGAAYVLMDQVDKSGLPSNINKINFKDDAGLALNAGLAIGLGSHLAITLDGKYVPLKSSATVEYATGATTSTKVKINPVIFSGGLTFRF